MKRHLNKEALKLKLKKWFPADKTLSDKKLKSDCRYYSWMQLFWSVFALLALPMLVFGARLPDQWQSIAATGAGIAFIAACMGQVAYWQIFEAEAKFELRLREALEDAKNNSSIIKA